MTRMAKMDGDEVERRLRQQAAEEALAEASEKDPELAKWLDDDMEQVFADLSGMSYAKLQETLSAAVPDLTEQETREAQQALKDASKALKGGWLSDPDPAKAEKILMGVRGIREVRNKRKGCFLFSGLILVVSASVAYAVSWGAVELVGALAR